MMGVPAVTYMATRNEYYDDGYYRLPNTVSHRCYSFEELRETLAKIFAGEIGPADGDEHQDLINYYLEAREGSLACERIVDTLEDIINGNPQLPEPPLFDQLIGRYRANWRRAVKWCKSHLPDSKYRPEFQRYRFPGLSLDKLESRIYRFQKLLGDTRGLDVEQISDYTFRIAP
jgi:hypothetical protein